MSFSPLRLAPGTDLRRALESLLPSSTLTRASDVATGVNELVVRPQAWVP